MTNTQTKQAVGTISDQCRVEDLPDAELALLIRNGQSELFAHVVARYQRKLYAYFFRVEREREEVEDLVQNVFLKVYQNLHRYDSSREFSSWIFSIAHNSAINHVKHASLKTFISLESITESENKPDFPSLEEDPAQACIRKETAEEVHSVIETLPAKYKQVLVLRYYYDKSYEEISTILGTSMNTVGTLIRRAKHKILAQIQTASGHLTALEAR